MFGHTTYEQLSLPWSETALKKNERISVFGEGHVFTFRWRSPTWAVFVPKSDQTVTTALLDHKTIFFQSWVVTVWECTENSYMDKCCFIWRSCCCHSVFTDLSHVEKSLSSSSLFTNHSYASRNQTELYTWSRHHKPSSIFWWKVF